MISFSSVFLSRIAADGVLALFIFWRGYKTPLFRVLGSTMCCVAPGGLKVIMTSSVPLGLAGDRLFHEKSRGGDIERKAYLWEFKY